MRICIRNECKMSCSFDSLVKLSLILRRSSGHSSRYNLASFGYVFLEKFYIFKVYFFDAKGSKLAELRSIIKVTFSLEIFLLLLCHYASSLLSSVDDSSNFLDVSFGFSMLFEAARASWSTALFAASLASW